MDELFERKKENVQGIRKYLGGRESEREKEREKKLYCQVGCES